MATRRLKVNANIGKTRIRGSGRFPSEKAITSSMQKSGKRITDALLNIFDQFEAVSEEVMIQALEPTLELADYYCPVDTGDLLESHYLEGTGTPSNPRVEIGYGRRGVPYYAAYVHEMVGIPHAEPTRSKWLQAAVMEDLENIYNRVGAGYKEFMGS